MAKPMATGACGENVCCIMVLIAEIDARAGMIKYIQTECKDR